MFVSLPLLAMLKEASSIEKELCCIIRNKDKQIDDYKASGAAVSRRKFQLFYCLDQLLEKFL